MVRSCTRRHHVRLHLGGGLEKWWGRVDIGMISSKIRHFMLEIFVGLSIIRQYNTLQHHFDSISQLRWQWFLKKKQVMRWQHHDDMLPSRVRRDIFLPREGHHCSCLQVHISKSTKPQCYDAGQVYLMINPNTPTWNLTVSDCIKLCIWYPLLRDDKTSWDEAWPTTDGRYDPRLA